jgi:aspartate kinase/aspartokinase/homoserine dehydrogenase 1
MNKIVVKFGGSNLKSQEHLGRLVRVIKTYDRPLVIVVSALYGVTETLYEILRKAREDESAVASFVGRLLDVHEKIVHEYIKEEKQKQAALAELKNRIQRLEKYLRSVNYIGEVVDFIEDSVVSYGERLSACVLAAILRSHGVACEEILPEDLGLITDGEFGDASVDFEKSERNIRERLNGGKTYVVPGFYGVSTEGKTTILGRGGSDYSAASIARCLGADSLDIWKDVDGFRTADPKIVPQTKSIPALTYREAAELAYFGAKILHPRTVEPLQETGIPLRIFNVETFDGKIIPQSVIANKPSANENVVKSVTYSDDTSLLKLVGPGVGFKHGILSRVTTALDSQGINIKSIITAQTCINFLLSAKDLHKSAGIVKDLNIHHVNKIVPQANIALVAIVGEGLLERHGIMARALGAVSEKGINVQMLSMGASEVAAYFIVDKQDRQPAIQAIHSEFIS